MAGNSILIDLEPNVDKFVSSIGAKLGAIGAAVGAALAFDKVLNEAMEADEALNSFATAARNAGQNVAKATMEMESLAESIQRTTTVSDDAITKNASLLVSVGRLSGEGLERATRAAVDLSAGLGKDLGTAFDIVTKATEGNVAALKKYGLEVSSAASDSQKLNAALSFIEERFGGSAAAKVNTFSGALAQLKNNFADVLEGLGKIFTRSPVVTALMTALSAEIGKAASRLGDFNAQGDNLGNATKKLLGFREAFVTYVVAPIELAYNVGKILFLGLQTGIAGIVSGVQELQGALFKYLIDPVVQFVAGPLGKLVSIFDKPLGESLANSISQFSAALTDDAQLAAEAATETFSDFAGKTNDAIDSVFNFDVSARALEFTNNISAIVESAKPFAQQAGKSIKQSVEEGFSGISFADILAATKNTANQIKFTADELAKNLIVAFQNGAGQAFAAFGAGLVTGKNAFAEFGKSILRSLGQLLIQFGGMLILVGAGLSTVPFLFGLSGPAAIAAGIAATIAGGALTALGGGGGGSSPAANAAGGVAATTEGGQQELAPSVDTTGIVNQEGVTDLAALERNRGPQVNVNIQGNVLDRRSTGLEIAEIISESFGGNAVVFT